MTLSRIPGRRLRHVLACAVLALGACGGGTSQYETYVPLRLIAFGDETSAITADGLKYSVNGTGTNTDGTPTNTVDCRAQANWVQTVAASYGFVFPECNPDDVAQPKGVMRAAGGARVADVVAQVDAQIAASGIGTGDLVTVLAGMNDIIDAYEQFPGRSEGELADVLRERGRALALQVNRIAGLDGRIIISTVPDMGLSPYARQQQAAFTDTDRAALLTRLTAAFNEQLGVNVLLDGRFVGLVQADLRIQTMNLVPSAFGVTNVSQPVCLATSPPPLCSNLTLVEGGSASAYLWSDDRNISFVVQSQIGILAADRARLNPF